MLAGTSLCTPSTKSISSGSLCSRCGFFIVILLCGYKSRLSPYEKEFNIVWRL